MKSIGYEIIYNSNTIWVQWIFEYDNLHSDIIHLFRFVRLLVCHPPHKCMQMRMKTRKMHLIYAMLCSKKRYNGDKRWQQGSTHETLDTVCKHPRTETKKKQQQC